MVYAGAWPVPLPLPTSFGGAQSYIDQLSVQLSSCDPSLLIYPPEIGTMCAEAARIQNVEGIDWASFAGRESYIDQLAVQLKSSDPRMLV